MTAFAITTALFARPATKAFGLGLALAAAVLVAGIVPLAMRQLANAATVTVAIPPARAAALIQATSGASANEVQAIGDEAKLINAAMPFTNDPLHAARPFAVGAGLDQRRALLCLTQAVYYEAGLEPIDGRRAVAQVVLNRLRHPAFPKSICGVVYQGSGGRVCQFTFVCDGALYRVPSHEQWREAEAVARAALAGYVETAVGEATHYHADYVAPRWAPLLAKVARVGQHIFYRWPGAWGQPAVFTGRYIGEPRDPLSLRPPLSAISSIIAGQAVTNSGIEAGPPVARAANDIGGLLDASKGWTLHIPGPEESSSSAAKLIAAQETKSSSPRVVTPVGGAALATAGR